MRNKDPFQKETISYVASCTYPRVQYNSRLNWRRRLEYLYVERRRRCIQTIGPDLSRTQTRDRHSAWQSIDHGLAARLSDARSRVWVRDKVNAIGGFNE